MHLFALISALSILSTTQGREFKVSEKFAKINQVKASYYVKRIPSDYYVNLKSKANQRDLPSNKVRESLTNGSVVTWVESVGRGYSMQIIRMDHLARKKTKANYWWDGSHYYEEIFNEREDGINLPKVIVDKDNRDPLNNENPFRSTLGSFLFADNEVVNEVDEDYINEGGQIQQKAGDTSNVLDTQYKSNTLLKRTKKIGGSEYEEIYRVRRDLNFAIIGCVSRVVNADGGKVKLMEWEAKQLRSTINGADKTTYHYPSEIIKQTYDNKSNRYFDEIVSVSECQINPDISGLTFKPVIEDGTNVVNFKSKQVVVHGNRISPRLRELIVKRVEESKKTLANEKPIVKLESTRSPKGYLDYISPICWIVGGMGILALAFIGIRRTWHSRTS